MSEKIEVIRKNLDQQIQDQSEYGDLDKASFNYQEGVILSVNDTATLLDHIDKTVSANAALKNGLGAIGSGFADTKKELENHAEQVLIDCKKQQNEWRRE